jgi:hypothetical protein
MGEKTGVVMLGFHNADNSAYVTEHGLSVVVQDRVAADVETSTSATSATVINLE